jgi:large subunit ribosomal protein L19
MSDIVRNAALKGVNQNKNIGDFKSGDTVGVYVRVREGEKERVQLYKGVVLKIQGSGAGRSFTVRKMSSGVGVERTFPFISPAVDRVEVISRGKVRRSRLYFLRSLRGKAAAISSELVSQESDADIAAKATK